MLLLFNSPSVGVTACRCAAAQLRQLLLLAGKITEGGPLSKKDMQELRYLNAAAVDCLDRVFIEQDKRSDVRHTVLADELGGKERGSTGRSVDTSETAITRGVLDDTWDIIRSSRYCGLSSDIGLAAGPYVFPVDVAGNERHTLIP